MDLDPLLATRPGVLGTDALVAHFESIQSLERKLAAAKLSALAELDRRRVWKRDGALSLAAWLEHTDGCTRSSAFRTAHTAANLAALPATVEALSTGDISADQAAALASSVTPETAEQIRSREQSMVEQAAFQTAEQTQKSADRVRARFTPEPDEPLALTQRRQRGIKTTRHHDGMASMTITFDPEAIQRADTIVAPVLKELAFADAEARRSAKKSTPAPKTSTGSAATTGDTRAGDEHRTHGQRHFDAFMHLLSLGGQARSQGASGAGPAEIITVLREDTYGRLRAQYPDGTPVHPKSVERLGCNARHIRVVLDAAGREVDLGTSSRFASKSQRQALLARDQGCRFPGCSRPHHWTQAHHIHHVEHGGSTSLDNLVSLCSRHHHLVHEGGFGLRRQPTGELVFTRPDGSHLATLPYQRTKPPKTSSAGCPKATDRSVRALGGI